MPQAVVTMRSALAILTARSEIGGNKTHVNLLQVTHCSVPSESLMLPRIVP